MRLVNAKYNINIPFHENKISVLIIEKPTVMYDTIISLQKQCDGGDGDFILTNGEEMLKINKKILLLTDIFSINLNEKKLLSKLYSILAKNATEYTEEQYLINHSIINALEKILSTVPYNEIIYNLEFDWNSLFKMYDIRFEKDYPTLVELLIEYVKLVADLGLADILTLVNITTVLSPDDLCQLYKMALYKKVHLLLIEATEQGHTNNEEVYIIDKDLCWIDIQES